MKEQALKKRKYLSGLVLLQLLLFMATSTVMAVDTEEVITVLKKNRDIFHTSTIPGGIFRYIGWSVMKGLVWVAEQCAKLFDESFKFIDFTRYEPVEKFLTSWKPVVFALISLSILFLGLIMIFWQEKKPKLMMNICLAVLIMTSSGYLIDQLNGFVTDDIRSAILNDGDTSTGSSGLVYDMVGNSIYDLIYIDDKLDGGLMKMTKNNRKLYDDFTKEDLELMSINEVLKPDDVKAESKDLVSNRIYYKKGNLELKEIYNGVAWTDLLNEYYYRYDVEWFTVIVGLVSLIIVYVCLAYKVVRILYEVVVQRLLAALYSANLSSGQKTLKILDSIKDSYITLILVMVTVDISTDNVMEVQKNINRSMKEQQYRYMEAQNFQEKYDAKQRFQEMERLYEEISSLGEVIKLLHIRIFVADHSYIRLEEKVKNILAKLESNGFRAAIFLNETKTEWESMYRPYKEQQSEDLFFIYGQPLTSNALAAGNPFHFSSLQDPCGDFLGKTPCGGNVLFDEFHKSKTRRFYNSLAVGTMGSGKSTLLKKRFLTNAIKGNYVRTFDISGEFTTLTKTLGGKVLKLDGTNGILNPLEVLKAEEGEEISFTRHISKVSTIYKFLTEGSADTEEIIEFEELLREL